MSGDNGFPSNEDLDVVDLRRSGRQQVTFQRLGRHTRQFDFG